MEERHVFRSAFLDALHLGLFLHCLRDALLSRVARFLVLELLRNEVEQHVLAFFGSRFGSDWHREAARATGLCSHFLFAQAHVAKACGGNRTCRLTGLLHRPLAGIRATDIDGHRRRLGHEFCASAVVLRRVQRNLADQIGHLATRRTRAASLIGRTCCQHTDRQHAGKTRILLCQAQSTLRQALREGRIDQVPAACDLVGGETATGTTHVFQIRLRHRRRHVQPAQHSVERACLVRQELRGPRCRSNKCAHCCTHGRHAVRRWRGLRPLGKRGSTLHALGHRNTALGHGHAGLRSSTLRRHSDSGRHGHSLCLRQSTNTALLSSKLGLQHCQNFRRRFHGRILTDHLRQFLIAGIHRTHVPAQVVHQDFRILGSAGHRRHLFKVRVLIHLIHVEPRHDARVPRFLGQGHREHGPLEDFFFHFLSLEETGFAGSGSGARCANTQTCNLLERAGSRLRLH